MDILFWLLTLLSLIDVILNIKKNRACFYIWAVANAGWAIIDFYAGLPQQGGSSASILSWLFTEYGNGKATTDDTDYADEVA